MFKRQLNDDDEILQTIQLTAKLQNNLRKIMSHRKNRSFKTQYDDKELDQSQISCLQSEVKNLRISNKELVTDNEQICRDLLNLKEQNRQLKKQLAENKKYITYLQGYTQDLKKQLVFWMRKPLAGIQPPQIETFGTLMTEVLKLRRRNDLQDVELSGLKKVAQPRRQKISDHSYLKSKPPLFSQSMIVSDHPSKMTKRKTSDIAGKGQSRKANMRVNECTSCNYLVYSGSKPKKLPSSSSFSHKKGKPTRALCECHRKYVETSQFLA